MNSFAKGLTVALAGLVSSVATAFLDVYLSRLFGFSIFTAMGWFVIPIGAIMLGCVAASGYYFASTWLNSRPSKALLIQMVAVAGATQLLIYYLAFVTTHLIDGRPVSAVLTFGQYLDAILTTGHIQLALAYVPRSAGEWRGWETGLRVGIDPVRRISSWGRCRLGEVVKIAVLSFVPHVLQKTWHVYQAFFNRPSATNYYERAFASLASKDAFLATLADGAEDEVGRKYPSFRIQLRLFACPKCKNQELDSTVYEVDDKQAWQARPQLAKRLSVPYGVDLSQGFAPKRT